MDQIIEFIQDRWLLIIIAILGIIIIGKIVKSLLKWVIIIAIIVIIIIYGSNYVAVT